MSELSWSEKILAERTVCVLLVRGSDPRGDSPVYAYVAVRADRLKDFVEAQGKEPFYPDEYGVIIRSGQGEPSDDVRALMERDYGFNHAQMMNVNNADEATGVAAELVRHVKGRRTPED